MGQTKMPKINRNRKFINTSTQITKASYSPFETQNDNFNTGSTNMNFIKNLNSERRQEFRSQYNSTTNSAAADESLKNEKSYQLKIRNKNQRIQRMMQRTQIDMLCDRELDTRPEIQNDFNLKIKCKTGQNYLPAYVASSSCLTYTLSKQFGLL